MPPSTAQPTRRQTHRIFDIALLIWGGAAATALAASASYDARQVTGWPRWLELTYLIALLAAVPALAVAGWAKARLRKLGAVVEDERTSDTHVRSLAAGLLGALAAQLPFFFHVETPSTAQAKITVAAALLTYGAARLWLNRES